MNHNLARPYGDGCSPPQTPYLSFHSPQSDTLLFDEGDTIEIRCQAGLRSAGLTWNLHRNLINTPFREGIAEALPGNRFRIALATAGLHPGFYDLKVELDTGLTNDAKDRLAKHPVHGVCTFGSGKDPERSAMRPRLRTSGNGTHPANADDSDTSSMSPRWQSDFRTLSHASGGPPCPGM